VARIEFPVCDYDLAATLASGQAFRWKRVSDHDSRHATTPFGVPPSGGSPGRVNAELQTSVAWEGVIRERWIRLRQCGNIIAAETDAPQTDWGWLTNYLRLDDNFSAILATFPDDEPMRAAVAHCRGLRLLRQEPWECLASFILSSTKQIVQIQQCVRLLCERFGEAIPCPRSRRRKEALTENPKPETQNQKLEWGLLTSAAIFAFPTAARLATATEAELRECKIGFRARYLLDAARRVSSGKLDLAALPQLPLEQARAALMECHGVGRKIADCALLFSLGFDAAFPIDVWVERALRQLYFPKRRVTRGRIERFAATHFGPRAGYAQQYLFHYLRTTNPRSRRREEAERNTVSNPSASSRRRLQTKT
jgi:N-glycosylase/DNA lyase